RLPMHYNLFTLPVEDEPVAGQHTWLETGFRLTDSLISWCARNEMYVILDLHAAPGGQGYESAISDYNPDKPSLWQSAANKDKTIALWRRLAERYADEPWIGGYDLINEPNWELPGNAALRNLYEDITAAIRTVDDRHIIFIEGNWFANDFTGLTPPWDDNMVYSPHKYWSFNNAASIQWVLSVRDEHQVPLYFGEWGENSNTWFRDVVMLFADHQLSWACWPMKKIESIAGPLSITKSAGYQSLLDYWNGQGPAPSADEAFDILMQLAEDTKLERCVYQCDVIDAMFRQTVDPSSRAFRPWSIPGVIYASDFDLGPHEVAYFDRDVANYQVSTGNYTAWNQGWQYRNDGVDLETCTDNINSNGYNLGWLEDGEWLQYSISVAQDAVYDVQLRVASEQGG
ncbi:MAG: cellulase family glycosylhydrolase, partial [Saprospiraceae bacterium]|nr:cellulase family glycosylhydrolase [Saprospiraceae bacterium]